MVNTAVRVEFMAYISWPARCLLVRIKFTHDLFDFVTLLSRCLLPLISIARVPTSIPIENALPSTLWKRAKLKSKV
jgi:hypothetical protein